MVHPNVIEFLTILKNILLQELWNEFDLFSLTIHDKLRKSLEVTDILLFDQRLKRFLCHLKCLMQFFSRMGQYIFDDLLHQHLVVTFRCHTRVGSWDALTDLVDRQESSASASLPSHPGYLFGVPSHHGFDDTEGLDDEMFFSFLICK
jgi:hypothetical protein